MLNTKQVQMNLKYLNYYKGSIDGIIGNLTRTAIRNFQKDNGLEVDGIYGEKTEGALVPMIKQIQIKVGTEADGVAGNNTIQKTKEYQSRNGLAPDGIAGVLTRGKLFPGTSTSWDNIKHFKQSEFRCHCGCGYDAIDLRLVKILDDIRDHYNSPLIITSGCRCQSHNKAVGGVQGSRHTMGKASDFYVKGVPVSNLLAYTKELVSRGILRYTYTNSTNMSGAVHIDIQ